LGIWKLKNYWQALTVSLLLVLNSFMKNRLIVCVIYNSLVSDVVTLYI